MYKVILDRSIFHGSKFDTLRSSRILDSCTQNRIRIWMTTQFIEETMRFVADRRPGYVEQWEYISRIASLRWFRSADQIVASELADSPPGGRYYLRPSEEVQDLQRSVQAFVLGDFDQQQYEEAIRVLGEYRRQREEFREFRKVVRREEPPLKTKFDDYYRANVEWVIENLLMQVHSDSQNFLRNWRVNRGRCRFTESYTRAYLAILYLPQANHNLPIGRNDGADADQLAYLRWTDIMVSDDERFMRHCFDLLYPSMGKRFFSLQEFLSFLNELG